MADKKSQINTDDAPVGVESVTDVAPANADKTSNPIPNDAEANQAPVRTNRPDVPIAQSLASGAGQHEGRVLDREVDGIAVDKDGLDRDGRLVGDGR